MRDWWTADSAKKSTEKADRLGAQYGQFEPVPGLKINSQLTMGENIGDLGGIEMAYAAYRRYIARRGDAPLLNGLNGDQRFFLAWGQAWRRKAREGRRTRGSAHGSAQSPRIPR